MPRKLLPLLILIFLLSCEDKGYFIKCSECLKEEPKTVDIKINLTNTTTLKPAAIVVYEGDIENNVIYRSFNSSGTVATTNVTLNKTYSFTATYGIGDSRYTTVDVITPKVILEKSECQDICYYIYDKTVDLSLKYSK